MILPKGSAGGDSSLSCAQLSMQLSRVSDLLILSGGSSHESEQYGRLAEQLGMCGDKSVELVEEEGYKGFSVRSRTLLECILKDIGEGGGTFDFVLASREGSGFFTGIIACSWAECSGCACAF